MFGCGFDGCFVNLRLELEAKQREKEREAKKYVVA